MPKIIEKSISILSDAGLGMAMFSLGEWSLSLIYCLPLIKYNSNEILNSESWKEITPSLLVCFSNILSCCHVSISIIERKLNLIITRGEYIHIYIYIKELICFLIRELRKSY